MGRAWGAAAALRVAAGAEPARDVLLEHHVEVGAAEAIGADARATRSPAGGVHGRASWLRKKGEPATSSAGFVGSR